MSKSKSEAAKPRLFNIDGTILRVQFVAINYRAASYEFKIWVNGKSRMPVHISEWLEDGITHVDLDKFDWVTYYHNNIKPYNYIYE